MDIYLHWMVMEEDGNGCAVETDALYIRCVAQVGHWLVTACLGRLGSETAGAMGGLCLLKMLHRSI
jgi:hypothetical protein